MNICFDIGGSWIKAVRAKTPTDLEDLGRAQTPLDDFDRFVDEIVKLVDLAAPEPGSAIAASITGVVDPRNGKIKCANIPCVDGADLASVLTQALKRPVLIANDADCYALAEAHSGAGRGLASIFAVILGSGVGGGLVIDGRVVNGVGGYAGEWGHGPITAFRIPEMDLDIPRFACECGQVGCVNTIGGARGLERLHAFLANEEIDSHAIVSNWQSGAPDACRTIDAYVALVSDPLALVINAIGPDLVPVGGGLSSSAPLIAALDSAVRSKIMLVRDEPLVVPGQCSKDAGLLGAAILAAKASNS